MVNGSWKKVRLPESSTDPTYAWRREVSTTSSICTDRREEDSIEEERRDGRQICSWRTGGTMTKKVLEQINLK